MGYRDCKQTGQGQGERSRETGQTRDSINFFYVRNNICKPLWKCNGNCCTEHGQCGWNENNILFIMQNIDDVLSMDIVRLKKEENFEVKFETMMKHSRQLQNKRFNWKRHKEE